MSNKVSRRDFLKAASGLGFGALLSTSDQAWGFTRVDNPLEEYPNRDWEQTYRELFNEDSSYVFLCAPNDTHNCLLRAYVKNGIVTRIGPTYGYAQATDTDGNRASARWDPRVCQKGLALTRRFYGDRRVRYPMMRRGFKAWVDAGYPRDENGRAPAEYMQRGWDTFERVTHDQALDYAARTMTNIATTYSGEEGAAKLTAQGYDPHTIEAMKGAGTQCLKFRGGMPLLGVTRVFGMYRLAGSLALLDAHIRGVGPDEALGGRGWDNYSWHTDLPPGHTMVTGNQTIDFDLYSVDRSKVVIVWGMNWIATKMPDAHWLTEARLKGTKVVVIACEYSATFSKADQAIVVRPGTTPALALGLAQVVMRDRTYDDAYVKRFTDLPLLVRMDTLENLRAADVFADYANEELAQAHVLAEGESAPPPMRHTTQIMSQALRDEIGDFVVWDSASGRPVALSRDKVGEHFDALGIDPSLEGTFTVTLASGETVECRPVFDLVKTYVDDNFTPDVTSEVTWAPEADIELLAADIAANPSETLFAVGMGPNQFFNNDLKDRAIFLLAALTANVGYLSGNVGSYAGNYRVALFNGVPQYIAENPFDIELDPDVLARPKRYWVPESAHYWNHEDKPLHFGDKNFTGDSHMPTPTKSLWFANANSILGNLKWHYNTVNNVLPRMEMICINEWWWSTSCEYGDIVMAVDSWGELKSPDMTASVTNPFITMFPETPLPRIHETIGDIHVLKGIGDKFAELTGDTRFSDMWHFVGDGQARVYLQRVLKTSSCSHGYDVNELLADAEAGIPALLMNRTNPRCGGWEQIQESKPWYTKTGRMEFYREEIEWKEAGENIPVHREPIDSTPYEPNVIVSKPHPAVRPMLPSESGVADDDLSTENRQGRSVAKPWSEVKETQHPLVEQGFKFIFHTPKYRHGAHTMPTDTDFMAVLFGPFGDMYRHDKRMPFVGEGYVDINPTDCRELGIHDGDYVWIDADPSDRPYVGWSEDDPAYKVARLMCRARVYPGTPRGVTRMWFNMYAATPGSVQGHETREDGLAKNENTNYQSLFRYGSHQSATRGWLKPTLMTDSLVRKGIFGQGLGKGFLPDSHCPTGAPRESFVKITLAEAGGINGEGRWRPTEEGLRPGYENEAFLNYLSGGYINREG